MPYNSQGTLVSDVKDHGEIQPGSPQMGASSASGVAEISNFRQITCYNVKMVQDRCIISIKIE